MRAYCVKGRVTKYGIGVSKIADFHENWTMHSNIGEKETNTLILKASLMLNIRKF